jgi:rhodanese-related sulfurtransferase
MIRRVAPAELKVELGDGSEIALIDVREEGTFSARHLLLASCIALSRLELLIDDLAPRRGTRIVLCDADDGLADVAAERLTRFGYANVAVLQGGIDAWATAGLPLFSGVNVPSKAFGEVVETACHTPRISAAELQRRLSAGEDLVVLDSRPIEEFRVMSIPGATDVPGAELVYHVHDLAPSPDTLVVVNCAGRTRSIIGAQSLINAGIPNKVVALKDGTMGWTLAGLELDRGKERGAPPPSAAAVVKARAAAERVAARFGVGQVDAATLRVWRADTVLRTTYLFDVRTAEEYQAGHLVGAVHAPGGQLVQATDKYAATRNARIVLTDDTDVRAIMTASWLKQMGWREVFVLAGGIARQPLAAGPHRPRVLGLETAKAATVTPRELTDQLKQGEAVVVDLELSSRYVRGHIPGAWFAVRARPTQALAKLPPASTLVLTSGDGALAQLAAAEWSGAGRKVYALAGGTDAWVAAGLPLESGMSHLADTPDDVWKSPYAEADPAKREAAMRAYLSWEVDLVEQVARDGSLRFEVGTPAG